MEIDCSAHDVSEVNENDWLQNGYKNFRDTAESTESLEYVDEMRIQSAAYHEMLSSES